MARKGQREASGHTILVVDDNEEYLASTVRLLAREGHDVFSASSGKAGLEIARRERLDVVLVDYFMPAMTGEQFVLELRTFAPYVQVVLQTGYSSERPAREMLRRLDIQGYHDKSEGPDKLCLWVDVAIRAAFTLQLLQKSRCIASSRSTSSFRASSSRRWGSSAQSIPSSRSLPAPASTRSRATASWRRSSPAGAGSDFAPRRVASPIGYRSKGRCPTRSSRRWRARSKRLVCR
jgi:CheY-like chemotaxis protein